MTRIVVTSKVGPDGVLHLTLPVGTAEANRDVRVTVEPAGAPPLSQEKCREVVMRTAGSITDPDFRRWEQGELKEREPLG